MQSRLILPFRLPVPRGPQAESSPSPTRRFHVHGCDIDSERRPASRAAQTLVGRTGKLLAVVWLTGLAPSLTRDHSEQGPCTLAVRDLHSLPSHTTRQCPAVIAPSSQLCICRPAHRSVTASNRKRWLQSDHKADLAPLTPIAPSDRAIRTASLGSWPTSHLGTCGNFRPEHGGPKNRPPIRGAFPSCPPVRRRPRAKVQVGIRLQISVQPPDMETTPI